jgi:hypothetical protein
MDSSSQQRRGGGIVSQSPSPSPSQTPRSTDKAARDLRSGDSYSNSSTKQDKEKGVNVQVIVRCRSVFLFSLFFFKKLENRKVGVLTCLLFFLGHWVRMSWGFTHRWWFLVMRVEGKCQRFRILLTSRLIETFYLTRFCLAPSLSFGFA